MSNIVGDSRRIYSRFYNNTGALPVLQDPAAVIYEVKINSAATVTYTYGVDVQVVKEAPGIYYLLLVFSVAGTFYVYCKGSGGIYAVGQLTLTVDNKLT